MSQLTKNRVGQREICTTDYGSSVREESSEVVYPVRTKVTHSTSKRFKVQLNKGHTFNTNNNSKTID